MMAKVVDEIISQEFPELQEQHHQQQHSDPQKNSNNQLHMQPTLNINSMLHYIQHEWNRFEMERQEWDIERKEMTAQIDLLQSEKKSIENLKKDLVRRIKMLEYCLQTERENHPKLENEESSLIDPESDDLIDSATSKDQTKSDFVDFIKELGYDERSTLRRPSPARLRRRILVDQGKEDPSNRLPNRSMRESKFEPLDIGELAKLTLAPEEANANGKKRQSNARYVEMFNIQAHLDCVRAICFCDNLPFIFSASEDATIKQWTYTKPTNNQQSVVATIKEFKPLLTYRGHDSKILSLAIYDKYIYSGAKNGELFSWKYIVDFESFNDPKNAEAHDSMPQKLEGHSDAIWALETFRYSDEKVFLCSGAADRTVRIWDITFETPTVPISIVNVDSSPTCIKRLPKYENFVHNSDIAISYDDGKIVFYDLNESISKGICTVTRVINSQEHGRINCIEFHSKLPQLVSGHSDSRLIFWELFARTERNIEDINAHWDELTSLALDHTGELLVTVSHDSSARLWSYKERKCTQDIRCHRKKFNEAILAVAFHPSQSHFATAGADGLVKIFMWMSG